MKITLCIAALMSAFGISTSSFALNLRYESGLLKAVSYQQVETQAEQDAIESFLKNEFYDLEEFHWKLAERIEDGTHSHWVFHLEYQNFPVFEEQLKIHFNQKGFVDYATSTLEKVASVPGLPEQRNWMGRKDFDGFSRGQLGLWWHEKERRFEWVFDVEEKGRGMAPQRRFVSAERNTVLDEKKIMRHWDAQTFSKFPTTPANPSASKTIKNNYPTESGKLRNATAWVRYSRVDGETYIEVTGNTSTLALLSEYDGSESNYRTDCKADNDTCTNQKVDAGNVYYHVTEFRKWMDDVDLTFPLIFDSDPLPMIINFRGFSIQKYTNGLDVPPGTQSNNAAYLSSRCSMDGSMDACLVFLQPSRQFCSNSADSPSNFYSLAREAVVVAHEYQHYLTDKIAGIQFGSVGTISVGDLLHEGYSDFFASSYVTQANNNPTPPVNKVGEYGFAECSNIQRDLSVNKVFDETEVYESPHRPGWVWASGLWELRTRLGSGGAQKATAIALKSLYYLPSNPGFIDSVEALVQADRALNGGAHENLIRTLFFDERKFLGTIQGVFQDSEKKIIKMGFQGCSSVSQNGASSGALSLLLVLIWLGSTLFVGRRPERNR